MPLSPRLLRPANTFTPRSISGLALWLDAADSSSLYTTDAGPVTAVNAPTDITGCALWLDASDSSTITHTGGAVSEWRDKTTNLRHFSATPTLRPSTGTRTQNGLNVIDFDGTKQMAGNAASLSLFRNASAGHVFIVQKMDVTSANQYVFTSSSGTNANVQRAQVFSDGSGNFCVGGTRVDGDSLVFISQGAISTNLTLVSAHFDWANSDLFLRRDGALSTSTTTFLTDGSTSNTDSLASVIGGAGAGYRLDGFIAELIVFNTAITPAQRASVEAYLAAKWGISGVHRSATQEIAAVGAPTELAGCVGWWDASSVSGTNGTPVQSLADLSANNGTATASGTSSNWPTIGSGLNGKNTIVFDGTRSGFRGNFASSQTTYAHSVFVVCKLTGAQSSNARLFSAAAASGNDYDAGNVIPCTVNGSNSDQLWQYPLNGPVSGFSGTWGIFAGTMSPSGVSATSYRNGSAGTTVTSASTTQTVSVSRFGIACDAQAGASKSVCEIAEVIYFNTALSTTDRARVEKYLANKWAISNVPDPTPPVGYWRDKSGRNTHVVTATAANRPLAGSENNRRALVFDGSNDNLNATPASVVGASEVTHIAVLRNNLTTQPSLLAPVGLLTSTNTGRPLDRWQQSATAAIFVGATPQVNVTSPFRSIDYRYVLVIDGKRDGVSAGNHQLREFINGASIFSATSNGTWATTGQKFNIGTRDDGATIYKGNVCEVLCYDKILSTSERQRLERYLAARWGITLAPQVSNPDAQDWINRVYANGSTVSATTAAAVNTFCESIASVSGLREKFYRLNLFCGGAGSSDTTRLNAALVPLYRGPSLGGTQYGGTTDTNAGGASAFIAADFTESAGLTAGLSSTKHLDTGLQTSALPAGVIDSGHLSAWHGAISAADTDPYFVAANNGSLDRAALQVGVRVASASVESCRYGKTTNVNASAGVTGARPAAFLLGQRTSATNLELWKNNSVVGTNTTSSTGIAGIPYNFYVFAANNAGTRIGDQPGTTLRHYSIGDDMTTLQVGAFYDALSAFNAAMGRV